MTRAASHAWPAMDAEAGELAVQFPGWRVWRSRPSGLWWATRRGNVHYHHAPRHPGWGITVGGVATLAELAAQLRLQRELDAIPARQP